MIARFFHWFWTLKPEDGIIAFCAVGVVLIGLSAGSLSILEKVGVISEKSLNGGGLVLVVFLGMLIFIGVAKRFR